MRNFGSYWEDKGTPGLSGANGNASRATQAWCSRSSCVVSASVAALGLDDGGE